MLVEIKQNWSNGLWWVRPVDEAARMKFRESHMDNGMWSNNRVADVMGRDWLQAFLHGAHDSNAWHVVTMEEV